MATPSKFEVFPENLVNYKKYRELLSPKTFDVNNFLENEIFESLRHLSEVNFLYFELQKDFFSEFRKLLKSTFSKIQSCKKH